ncbi:MAG: double-strand break repair helicase AddA [Hyphomicrobiales bacterium]
MRATNIAAAKATKAQARAGDPAVSAWVSASAGSGKTHVLVARAIRLMLSGTPPGRILCLTFTRAAAAEMANRLFKRLSRWIALGDDALSAEIQRLSGLASPFAGNLATARRLFTRALETPGGLKIQTIHAFCEKLLQRFPIEAGVIPGFEVMDERAAGELIGNIRAAILSVAATAAQSEPGRALDVVSRYVNATDFDTLLKAILAKRTELARLFAAHGGVDGAMAGLRARLGLGTDDRFETLIPDLLDRVDRNRALKARRCLGGGGKRNDAQATLLDILISGEAGVDARLDAMKRLSLTQKGQPKADRSLMSAALAAKHPDVLDFLAGMRESVVDYIEREGALHHIEATQAALRLGHAMIGGYEAAKRERGRYDYDDLIARALGLFAAGGQAGWVLYKLDGGIDHILIDEAQDTSPDQWRIVRAIADEFHSGLGARGDMERTVFVVGDRKQSIYSFQGAEADGFDAMRGYFRDRARGAGKPFATVDLNVSFRSTKAVLEAVDRVFANGQAARGLSRDGTPLMPHAPARAHAAGLVEIWPVEKPPSDEKPGPWDAPLDAVPRSHPATRLAEKIASTIRGWLDDGEILASAGRPIRPGDILILLRRRDRFMAALAAALKRRNVPVAGVDRLELTGHIAVMDLMALARFMLMQDDDLTLATLLKSPLLARDDGRPLTDDDLFALCHGRKGTLWRALRDAVGHHQAPYLRAVETLENWLARADAAPPYEFFARILGAERGRAKFAARFGVQANDPLDEFLRAALDHDCEHTPSLQGFIDWLERASITVNRDMAHGGDEARIMTVHGAKGLEADIVFMPDTCSLPRAYHGPDLIFMDDRKGGGPDLPLWLLARKYRARAIADAVESQRDRQLEEYNRLLYVAMTRARDRLYICGHDTGNRREPGCWYDLIVAALKGLGEEVSLADGSSVWRIENLGDISPSDDVKETPAPPPTPGPLGDWAFRPAARQRQGGRPDVVLPSYPNPDRRGPSGEDGVSPLAVADDPLRYRRGLLIHRLLQSLPELKPEARLARARRFLSMPVHGLDGPQVEEITSEVMAVLDHPELGEVFAPGSLAEVPITAMERAGAADGKTPPVAMSGRIDRLAIKGDDLFLVDFKTERSPPVALDDVPAAYLRQLGGYGAALRRIFPEKRLRAAIVWTKAPRLMDVPADRLHK